VRERLKAWTGVVQAWSDDYSRHRFSLAAGGLAYFVALSIGPAALALGALAGLVLEPEQVRSAIDRVVQAAPISDAQGDSIVAAVVGLVESASTTAFTVTTVVGVLVAVYAASKVVLGVRHALSAAFGDQELRRGLIERAFSAVVTLVALVVGVAAVVAMTLVPRIVEWLGLDGATVGTGSGLWDWIALSAAVYALAWVALRFAPAGGHRMRVIAPGPLITTAGVIAVTAGVGIYAQNSGSLGAAVLVFGTAIVGLLWLYLCFVALMWGAVVEASRTRTTAEGPRSEP
jgi:membrane protein